MVAKTKPFRTILDPAPEIETTTGTEWEEVLALRINETGDEEFYVKGKTNIYEKIQTFADDVDLEKILIRCSETGDLTLLNQKEPFFMDMTDIPENIFEAHRKIRDAEEAFANMPLATREAYDNNFSKFLADFGTDNWLKNVGLYKEEVKTENKTKGETTEE